MFGTTSFAPLANRLREQNFMLIRMLPGFQPESPGSCKLQVKASSVKDALCDHACINFRSVNHRVYCSEY